MNMILLASALLFGATALPNAGVWNDTDGVMINAHGGALVRDGATWYWFGEHKTEGKGGNTALVGVHCYSSGDLLNWKNEGVALSVTTNPSPIESGCILERPKVAKAPDGSGWVMFFHLEPKGMGYGGAQTGIAKSKTIAGPYELVWAGRPNKGKYPRGVAKEGPRDVERPFGGRGRTWRCFLEEGQMSRDMTLFTDPKDGKLYHIFASEDNGCLHLSEVRSDGLGYTGAWTTLTPGDWTEAPALVKRGDWYFLLGSGCTGWRPNAARYYRAKSVWGPWERMGNPCRGERTDEKGRTIGVDLTWGGQSTGIFTTDQGVSFAMFDIWRPHNAIDGRYVWVPIAFNDRGEMTIDWRENFEPKLDEPWQDEYVSEINRLPACSVMNPKGADRVLSLDGDWDFTFVNGDQRESCTLAVPGCWQVQGARLGKDWDPPLYINIKYPIAYDPPRVMTEPNIKSWTAVRFRNPRGIYRKRVALPESWSDRLVTLRLNGYDSAVYVRVNGKTVGYGEDGRLPSEWNLTPYVGGRDFDLEIEVLKHSDSTYLEDQDFWRMSGLFRSVELVSEAKDGLYDFTVDSRVSHGTGVFSVKPVFRGAPCDFTWKFFDARDDEICAGRGSEEMKVPNVALWSPNRPNLYRVEVSAAGDRFDRRFGFRTVTVENGILKLNGERVVIYGVNRHEMSPKGGYTMTRAEMEKDIEVLKEFNINAVRTSHYPNDPYWYDLCDKNGILVVAEANIECHGSGHPLNNTALSHVPGWRKAFVERNLNQVAILRDHPSVIAWSTGNESGTGANMVAAYAAVKAADPTRPVQYEGIYNPYGQFKFDRHGSDIICPMYETPEAVEKAMARNFEKPYILCEFSHSMGNSNGNFDEYMKLIEKYPSFQGGFIWDFADQGIEFDGKLRYGGDFGDKPNDGTGACDGLFDAYRNPHPGACEVAYFYGGKKELNSRGEAVSPLQAAFPLSVSNVVSSLRRNFWRAPTDNDRGNRMSRECAIWREATEKQTLPEGVFEKLTIEKVNGEEGYAVDWTLTVPAGLPEIPRVGLTFDVPGSTNTLVRWHGAGPWENYSDRRTSASIGDYALTVAELNDSHYIRPQEMGHRTATTELVVVGLSFAVPRSSDFEWNVLPWTTAEIESARHVEELPAPDGTLHVSIDAAMRGVGGDDSWGKKPHRPYRLEGARTYRLQFTIHSK